MNLSYQVLHFEDKLKTLFEFLFILRNRDSIKKPKKFKKDTSELFDHIMKLAWNKWEFDAKLQ